MLFRSKEISCDRQIIVITHLPQIASFADLHLKATKSVVDGRTLSAVTALDSQARIKELAQMMSGEKETEISKTHAQAMLVRARK